MVSSVLEWRENLSFLSFTSKTIDIWNIFKKWHLQLLKSCYDIMYILIKKRCMDANSDVIHPPCSSRLLTLCCIGNFPNFWFHCYIIGYSWCALIVLEFIISGLLRLFCLSVFVKRGNFTFFFFRFPKKNHKHKKLFDTFDGTLILILTKKLTKIYREIE